MKKYFLIFILIININISSETSITENIIIYSEDLYNIICDSHFYYLSMNISSNIEITSPISFELNLVNPPNIRMKCLIYKNQLDCFSFVPDGSLYRSEELFFNLFYSPPKIKGIEFDAKSFRKRSRRWFNATMCGNGNSLLNDTKVDFTYWKKMKMNNINGGECKYYYEDKEQKNEFYFNMSLDIEDENLINYLNENKDENIKFIQEIKAPIFLKYQDYKKLDSISSKDYAFCQNNQLINYSNYKNIDFLCKITIPRKSIINSEIKLYPFFDKILYIKGKTQQEYNIQILNIFINLSDSSLKSTSNKTLPFISQKYTVLTKGKTTNFFCPNLPIFNIKNKYDGIYYGSYSNKTNRFYFYLKGVLTNGYKYHNNSLTKLSQTTQEISFPLYLTDNSLEDLDEIQTKCILSSSSFYNEEDTLIQCFGNKNFSEVNNNENIIIDMNMNYVQKKNNIFSDIIINWPERQFFGNKKNFFSVKIYALSIKRKYSVCEDGNFFTFYINIYDMNKEIKIIFDLPLVEPSGYVATCELFDRLTLVCTIDLRFKKILKFEKIVLPEKDKEIRIFNEDGNEIVFKVYDQNNFIKMEEDCGENVVFGAMKEIGISKKKGIIISISIIIFLLLLIAFGIFYIIHLILRCKKGKKLPTTEESKIHK